MAATTVPGDRAPSLERDAIGLPEVLFQSITHMAPAVATALSIGFATTFAGRITPLAVLLAMIACLFTAYSIGQLAKHLPSAGGMYTYVTNGLGPFFGWLMAWAFALAEPLIAASRAQVDAWCGLGTASRRLADAFWPGPLSLVCDAPRQIVPAVHAGRRTVAVRVPAHAIARTLAAAWGAPITATSANRTGAAAAQCAADLDALADDRLLAASPLD